MPSTTTTNITIGSLLELLAPTAANPRDGQERAAFDALLQPPPLPAARHDSQQPDRRLADRQAHSDCQTDDANSSATRCSQPTRAAGDDVENDEAEPGYSEYAAGTGEASVANTDGSAELEESADDEEALSASLAGLALTATAAPVLEVVETSAANAETLAIEQAAVSAAQTGGAHNKLVAAGQFVDQKEVSEESPADPLEFNPTAPEVNGSPRPLPAIVPAAAQAAADAAANESQLTQPPSESLAETEAAAKERADSTQEFGNLAVQPVNPSSSQGEGRNESSFEPTSSLVAEASIAEVQKPLDAVTMANQGSAASAAAAALPVTQANQSASSSNTAPAPSGAAAISGGRSRLPGEAAADGAGETRRSGRIAVDTARLLGRVTRAFQAAQQRDGEIQLRLSPPELGSLRLIVQVQDGALVARLETETSAARATIIENLPALRERLAEQGLRIERFDVDLMQQQAGGMPDRPRDQDQNTPPPVRVAAAERPRSDIVTVSRSSAAAIDPNGRLNVII